MQAISVKEYLHRMIYRADRQRDKGNANEKSHDESKKNDKMSKKGQKYQPSNAACKIYAHHGYIVR